MPYVSGGHRHAMSQRYGGDLSVRLTNCAAGRTSVGSDAGICLCSHAIEWQNSSSEVELEEFVNLLA